MYNKDIKTLIKVLKHKKREDLAGLLKNCSSEIDQSGQYGSRFNSVISTFWICAPVEDYYKLKKLRKKDNRLILKSVIDFYPVVDEAPEITSVDFKILKEGEYAEDETPSYIGRTIRVFLSYTTSTQENKTFTGNLKQGLEKLGLEVFLAHEDINPSSDWQETILANLKSTDIFMPIITEDFRASNWTDQESGIAFGDKKFIFPVAVDGNITYGFLAKIQAFKVSSGLPIDTFKIMEAVIKENPGFSNPLLDSLIKVFANSYSYDDAGIKSGLLLKFDTMTAEQANEIFRNILLNNQIYGSHSANDNINEMFKKYKHLLDVKLIEKLREKKGLLDAENQIIPKIKKPKLLDIPF
jgi:hypothetical protein